MAWWLLRALIFWDERELVQQRIHTMKTLVNLSKLFEAGRESQFNSQVVLSDDQESQIQPSHAINLKFDVLIRELLRSRSHESNDHSQHLENDSHSPYLVIGWFLRGCSDPYERLVTPKKDENLFKDLRKKCDIPRGAHVKLSLHETYENTISHFFRAYQTSRGHPDEDVNKAWPAWIQKNLNAKNNLLKANTRWNWLTIGLLPAFQYWCCSPYSSVSVLD
ncbi:uncharacterized protein RSE6_04920 [Rhynchosporium secalis]|uniref:Uncharacterized protein n=1 Tax=Rhynchosporium secalis TaxID=38038 RepID=A0A1E1M6I5_RHYSE|nr:uncharacterized protein RSE6_04920 [Rhynchosporium secalis]